MNEEMQEEAVVNLRSVIDQMKKDDPFSWAVLTILKDIADSLDNIARHGIYTFPS